MFVIVNKSKNEAVGGMGDISLVVGLDGKQLVAHLHMLLLQHHVISYRLKQCHSAVRLYTAQAVSRLQHKWILVVATG